MVTVTRETSERIGGAAFLTVPAFEGFVSLLDNYARIELLVRLRDYLPTILTSPVTNFVCLCLGLWLLYLSNKEQLKRVSTGANNPSLVDTSGSTIRSTEKPKWLLPVCVGFVLTLLATPIVAVGYSLAYKGAPPRQPRTPNVPFFAYDKTPSKPLHGAQPSPSIVAIAPNGIANVASNRGTQTVNNFGLPDRHVSLGQRDLIVSELRGKVCAVNFIGVMFDAADGQTYATELRDSFKAAGCRVPDDIRLVSMGGSGPEPHGIQIEWNRDGASVPNGERVSVDDRSPAGIIISALLKPGVRCRLVGNDPQLKEGEIGMIVARQ
jgi:hypothetical protein